MKESFVGIIAEDSPELFIGLFGILKSGNAFVPINPVFPNHRLHFIINDCGIRILLTDNANREKARQIAEKNSSIRHVLTLEDFTAACPPVHVPKRDPGEKKDNNYCYVIYTSGSTGRPKGVPITHGNLVPLFSWFGDYFQLGTHTRILRNLSYTFDFGVFEILTTLIYGGCAQGVDKVFVGDFSRYASFIDRHQVNTLHTTPVFFSNISGSGEKIPSLDLLHLGGERLTGKTVRQAAAVISPRARIYNGYGPTETTVNCAIFALSGHGVIEETDNIPIGGPSAFNELSILDKHGNPQPVGVPGELYVSGPGLAHGYLNRPELTMKSFLGVQGAIFQKSPLVAEGKKYKTGDLCQWLPDGNIRFLGRIDHQVKVRGFRIELGEIENALRKHPIIKEAVVVARQHQAGSNYLCAYFVADTEITLSQLREFLLNGLPDYMVPAYFIPLETIPLTPNGKTDLRALPEPDHTAIDSGVEYITPQTRTQHELVLIWRQLLQREKIGIHDDFFELGGDSILVNRCIAHIREDLRVEIPLRTFFERPYIKALAEEIENRDRRVSSIIPAAREGEIPLSFAQERLWFLQELDSENTAYFVPRVIRMKGDLDITLVERTFTEIIRRHEILRTVFPTVDGTPVQRIQPPFPFKISVLDWCGIEAEEQTKKINEFLTREGVRPFNFETGPLLRVTILKLKEKENLLVLTEHHLVHDGWTQGVLLREFIAIFTAYSEGKDHRLPGLPIQYADYAVWQRDLLRGDVLEHHLSYWEERLSGLAPVLDLPTDRPRPPVISGEGGLNIFRLSPSFTRELKDFSRKHGVTYYMTLLTVFKVFLYRYTGVEDLCVGTGIANRGYKEMEGMLGMVINTLPLRTRVRGDIAFDQCLRRVKETCLEAYQHEDTPFGKIVERINPPRSLSYTPIFQVIFSFMDTPTEELRLPGLDLELLDSHNRSSKFDINVVVVPPPENNEDGETLVEWEYNTDIFDASTVDRMVDHYNRLLEKAVHTPGESLSALPMLSGSELNHLLNEFNHTVSDYPRDKTIHQLFEEQALRTPDAAALNMSYRSHKTHLTYSELNLGAHRLARTLKEKGAVSGGIVGIIAHRSIEMIVGILGVLKTGAAYLPIDPNAPEPRQKYMMDDCGVTLLLECSPGQKKVKAYTFPHTNRNSKNSPGSGLAPHENFAYVIYTSGSTGNPKGVPVTHSNFLPLLLWGHEYLEFQPGDRVIQFPSYYFDWSVWDIFLILTSGACMHIITDEILLNPEAQLEFIRKHGITAIEITPAQVQALFSPGPGPGVLDSLRLLCIGADRLTLDLVRDCYKFISKNCRVLNMYGPTEATIITAVSEIDREREEKYIPLSSVPIGKPVGGSPLLVLDKDMNICPVNVKGELYIAGDGVSKGYLNDVVKTSKVFLKNSFRSKGIRGDYLYKTGDLVRWIPDGEIEFIGRVDHQVKIRGLRIELGEIESRLKSFEKVKEAVVLQGAGASGDKYLCAYFVPEGTGEGREEPPDVSELRAYLGARLPDYMIPSYFIPLEKMPLNPNGKVDRRALPEPGTGDTVLKSHIAPRDEVEERLVEIWADVLGIEKENISIDSEFFELGGHSLNATVVVSRIHKTFNVKVPVVELFVKDTIRELARYIKETAKDAYVPIGSVEKREYYELSQSQKRIWVQSQIEEASLSFNIKAAFRIGGDLNKAVFENVFKTLIQRHESLRTIFISVYDRPVQEILAPGESGFTLEFMDLRTVEDSESEVRRHIDSESDTPFDLTRGPLFRAKILRLEERTHIFIFTMHHIVSDGTSMDILFREVLTLYDHYSRGKENPLSPLSIQYKDYAAWQNRRLLGGEMEAHETYWFHRFRGELPVLELPFDKKKPPKMTYRGDIVRMSLEQELTRELKALARRNDVTLFMVFAAVVNVLLCRYAFQEDIVIGTPIAGREHADLEGQVGFYLNTIALRTRLEYEETFTGLLNRIKAITLNAYKHQVYPFDRLVERLGIRRDFSRHPIFDVMVDLINFDAFENIPPGLLTFTPLESGYNKSKFDLTIYIIEREDTIDIKFEYYADLFERETITHLSDCFFTLVNSIIESPVCSIADLQFETGPDPGIVSSISRALENKMRVPASYHQERLWFIDTFESGNLYPSGPVYHNIPILLTITGPLSHRVLEKSIREVIHRHEALRTRIITADNKPVQFIDTPPDFTLPVSEVTAESPGKEHAEAVSMAIEESQRPFLIDKEPLIRAKLFQINDTRSLLLFTLHHAIADNRSLEILVTEIFTLYNGHLAGIVPRLPQPPIQYVDFSQWQRQMPAPALKSLLRYWKGRLKGKIQPLEMPTDRPRAAVHIFHAAGKHFALTGSTARDIRAFAGERGIGIRVLLSAAFHVLLHRYSGQEDVVVGISAGNRTQPGTESLFGPAANLLVINSQIPGKSSFHELIADMNRVLRDALKYQAMPFDRLVLEINPHKDMSRTALFDVLFQYRENMTPMPEVPGLTIEKTETNLGWGKYDLNLLIQDNEEKNASFDGVLVYNADYYDETTIQRFIRHYQILLENLLKDPHKPIDALSMLSEEEKHRLVNQWNRTAADFADDKTIHRVFEEQAERTPDSVALYRSNKTYKSYTTYPTHMTYAELNRESDLWAKELREKGVSTDTIVAVRLGRSSSMIAVLLGILKAGGAYLPIDPDYPEERIRYTLADSGTGILVRESGEGIEIIDLPGKTAKTYNHVPPHPPHPTHPTQLAYVIYTSGTTGRPKGCTVSHRNVLRLLTNDRQPAVFNTNDVWIMAHSYCFDFSVWEMYGALLCGGGLVVPPRQTVRDTAAFLALIRRYGVTVLNQTPAAFYSLIAEEKKSETKTLDRHLRVVIFGGDRLEPAYLKPWIEMYPPDRVRLINMYGITETTIHVTHYTLGNEDIVAPAVLSPIGVPLPETTVYVFNPQLQLQPPGVTGELYVGGSGVSRGYLNNPLLTRDRFLENPYKPGEILYRTGDLGRWQPDGSIRYSGRIDHQVQLRGFRIEMGEIESQLLGHENIKEAVVICREKDGGDKHLCAYIVPGFSGRMEHTGIKQFLSQTLPDYMIPSFFVFLDKIPLTSNGKVDRKSLPEPDVVGTAGAYTPPRDTVDEKLAEIWAEVLNLRGDTPGMVPEIGIDANFFELGGHSLKAATLTTKIYRVFDVKIPLAEIFMAPTIRGLADYIRSKRETGEKFSIIDAVEKREYYPLSSAQKRLYILQQLDPEIVGYNMPTLILLEGELQTEKIEAVFRKLIARHESFRTSFELIDEEPVQKVHKEIEFNLEFYEEAVGGDMVKRFVRPFNLTRAPLLRAELVKEGEDRYILLVDMHHIVSDGTSIGILVTDFMACYGGKELPGCRLQYKDYAEWERRRKGGEAVKKQESFWLSEYGAPGEIPVLDLPADYSRPPVRNFEGGIVNFTLGAEDTRALKVLVKERGVTQYMALLTIYNVLLYKLTGQETIVVGTPTAGRPHVDLEHIIGMFVNTLALKNFPAGEKTFNGFLIEVKEKTLNAFSNQDYQYDELVEKVLDNRDAGRNPLFDTMFILQNLDIPAIEIPGLTLKPYKSERTTSKFDLTLECTELEDTLSCSFEYSTNLFKRETIEGFVKYFKQVIAAVLGNPDSKLSEIDVLTEREKRQLIVDFNDTAFECPRDKTIYRLFEDRVDRSPDHTALVFKDSVMTFRQLDERANGLAGYLSREKGVRAGDRVAVLMERSFQLIIALLGAMKSGGAYVPLDPMLPKERLRLVLNDASVGVVVSQEKFSQKLAGFPGLLSMDGPGDGTATHSLSRPGRGDAGSPAYVMYTSGSSGTPKGVLVEHRTIVNTLWWRKDFYEYNPGSVSLQNPPYFFDSSVTDIFTPLLGGARLVLIDESERMDLVALRKIITLNRVTHFIAVPAFYNALLEEIGDSLKGVKIICAAGEHFPDELVKKHFGKLPGVRITNEYGPTENSVNTTIYELKPNSPKALIGKPIWNVGVFILDRYRGLCPIGVTGEICLFGSSLARGYLNNPELTAQKFNRSYKSYRTYFTGDLGRRLPDGNLEFLGRVDTQVKIRGMRIEVGEIESHLMRHEDIKEAVVLAHEDPAGEKYLCAYIVTPSTPSTGFREYLSQLLPDYMIPSYFVELDRVPLTPSGKIDRQALPVPGVREKREYVPPRDETEKKLVHIWSEILGIEEAKIGIDSNFFELGGHSLRATIVASRIHRAFNVNLPLAEIFKTPFIRGLAKYITGARKEQFVALDPVEKREYYALSPAQKRLYLLQGMDPDSVGYNMPRVIPFPGDIDKPRLEWTFFQLIRRHESLRTSFHMVDDELVQRIHDSADFEIGYLNRGNEKHKLEISTILNDFTSPFDLSRAPLLRVRLIRDEEQNHFLLIDMHHIITDGTSHTVLKDEFNRLYSLKEDVLPPPRIQYKDYAGWINNERQQDLIKAQETYWLTMFGSEVPVLELPLDYPRPPVQSFEGNNVNFLLTPGQTRTLKELADESNATLYMVLSAVFYVLLSKLSGQEDIVVGTPTAGRRHADLESIIGMFVNTLPIRNYPVGEKRFKDFLREVKEQTLRAYENQDYPFEVLVDKINVRRDTGRNPVFDVMLDLSNQEDFTGQMTGIEEYRHEKGTAKFDLTLNAVDLGERLLCTFEYCGKLFEPSTIDRFIGFFREIAAGLSPGSNPKLSELEIITETVKYRILHEFNDTAAEYPKDKTIRELFEAQVAVSRNRIAVVGPGSQIKKQETVSVTYRELDSKASRLAHMLRKTGVLPGAIVGMIMGRSVELLIGILGILKAGGAYLPIEPGFPGERIRYMLEDSGVEVLVTTGTLVEEGDNKDGEMAGRWEGKTVFIETLLNASRPLNSFHHLNLSSPAYVIYTSGSTGRPKGVVVEHRGIIHYLFAFSREFDITSSDIVLQQASYCFDVFVEEVYPVLSAGGKIAVPRRDAVRDIDLLCKFISRVNVTIVDCSPLLLNELNKPGALRYLDSVRVFISGGDVLKREYIDNLIKAGDVYNTYGPTETTVCAAYHKCAPGDNGAVPIGKPITNYTVHILDNRGNLLPIGIPGELCIGGDGVARGYLNRPELTAERFYRSYKSYRPHISYRTGDLGRWRSDGTVEFLGRIDHQVKIRGFRVELGEIETHMATHPGIKEAAVINRKDRGREYLCAYFTAGQSPGPGAFPVNRLKEYLEKRLPDYMLPSCFVEVKQIPRTVSGKVDRKRLPEPLESDFHSGGTYEAPDTDTQRIIAEIWQDVLGREKVGVRDNFFDLGGNSLDFIKVSQKLKAKLGKEFPVMTLFTYPTIRSLELYLTGGRKTEAEAKAEAEDSVLIDEGKDLMHLAINKLDDAAASGTAPQTPRN